MNCCKNIPILYLEASIKEKQSMLRTFIDTIEYYDGVLTIKFKPIFDSLRKLKKYNCKKTDSLILFDR